MGSSELSPESRYWGRKRGAAIVCQLTSTTASSRFSPARNCFKQVQPCPKLLQAGSALPKTA
eukprot:11684254-Alexandrium_andersonii.AAC.1